MIRSQDGGKPGPKQKQGGEEAMEIETANPDNPEEAVAEETKGDDSSSSIAALERPEKKRLHWEGLTCKTPYAWQSTLIYITFQVGS